MELKQTDIGMIPEDWEVVALQDVCKETISYGIVQCGPHIKDGIPYIRVSDMEPSKLDIDKMLRTDPAIAAKFKRSTVQTNDLVYALRGRLGDVRIIPPELNGANLTQGTARISPDSNIVSSFLIWAMKDPRMIQQAELESKGTTFKEITLADLRKLKIILPTKNEQEAIAEVLSDTDAYIESLEKLIAKKRLIKKGVMQELLSGKRRLLDNSDKKLFKETELGLIPNDWIIKSVNEIGSVGRGRVINHTEIGTSIHQLYPVFSSQTSNKGVMGYIDTYDFEGEYITWTTDGANAGTVFYRNGRFNCTNVCGTIKALSDDPEFVAYQLDNYAKSHVSRQLGNPKLMNDVMKKVLVPIPTNIKEQKAISRCLNDFEKEIEILVEKLEKTKNLKQGTMQELLTGRIRLV